MVYNKFNILLCLDDVKWDYSRHCAVTILSLLETNKNHEIKIFIMSSILPKENIEELKRIVKYYHQEIEFIISDNIVPEELKKVIINKNNLTRGTWYRWFFPKFIKWIDRILYLDCDVLVMKDIADIYNMDMHWKTIAWYHTIYPYCYKNKIYGIKQYFNSWVLLFDAKKYNTNKISVKNMEDINKKFSKYYMWWDEEKMNILYSDDIYVTNKSMNYQIASKWFNKWLDDAHIVHCLKKPYIQYDWIPQKLIDKYNKYLSQTKWKWYPPKKAKYWYFKYIYNNIKEIIYLIFIEIMWKNLREKYAYRRLSKIYK